MNAEMTPRWVRAAFLLLLLQLAVLAGIYARLGLPSVLLWYVGRPGLILAAAIVLTIAFLEVRRRQPYTWVHAAGYVALGLVVASVLVVRSYPSSWDDRPSATPFQLPLDGPVTVAWGGPTRRVNYHAMMPDQRWAYDLLITRDGRSYRTDGADVEDYYAYGLPILAPADGIVHAARDGDPDEPVGQRRISRATGNHIVLQVGPTEYLFIAHLKPGSVRVAAGERVTKGQVIGLVGNSGNSSEPHVHLHLQDRPTPYLAEGIPFFFHEYLAGGDEVRRGMPHGGWSRRGYTGDIVQRLTGQMEGDSSGTPPPSRPGTD